MRPWLTVVVGGVLGGALALCLALPATGAADVTVGPSLGPELYRRVLRRMQPELERCLVRPRGHVSYTVRFVLRVPEEGPMELIDVTIPPRYAREGSRACLAEVIARHPSPGTDGFGTLTVRVPLVFRGRGG